MLPEDVWGNAWKQFRQMGIKYNHSNETQEVMTSQEVSWPNNITAQSWALEKQYTSENQELNAIFMDRVAEIN